MTFERLVLIALLACVVSFVGGMVLAIKKTIREDERLKLAKEKGWYVETKIFKRKNVDSQKLADTEKMKSRSMIETIYEYEIHGRKKRVKIRTDADAPKLDKIYYDPDDRYRVLNLHNSKRANAIVIIPMVVLVGIMLIGKIIFKV